MSDENEQVDQTRMSLGEHLEELRRRLIYALVGLAAAACVGLAAAKWIIVALERPYRQAAEQLGRQDVGLTVLSIAGGLGVYMKVSLYFGLLLAGPWILYHLWAFVSAGLYRRERHVVWYTLPFIAVLFLGGAAFFYWLVAARVVRYLLQLSIWLELTPIVTLDNHVGFMLKMMLAFGLAFQTPLAVLLLAKVGLVDMRWLRGHRRHVIVAILVFAAFITPPDALSMLALAVPMWALYELGVLLAHLLVFRRQSTESTESTEGRAG